MSTRVDVIRKQVSMRAPIERVWRAISDAQEFGKWFGVDTTGQRFEAGKVASMKVTDPPEYAGMEFTVSVVEVVPPRLLSFRWHPGQPEPGEDLSAEPTTLIEFGLERDGDGTRLTITESGFEGIPEHRRAAAFRSNEEGWTVQAGRVREYVDG